MSENKERREQTLEDVLNNPVKPLWLIDDLEEAIRRAKEEHFADRMPKMGLPVRAAPDPPAE